MVGVLLTGSGDAQVIAKLERTFKLRSLDFLPGPAGCARLAAHLESLPAALRCSAEAEFIGMAVESSGCRCPLAARFLISSLMVQLTKSLLDDPLCFGSWKPAFAEPVMLVDAVVER